MVGRSGWHGNRGVFICSQMYAVFGRIPEYAQGDRCFVVRPMYICGTNRYIYIYIHTYIYIHKAPPWLAAGPAPPASRPAELGKGQMGSALMEPLQVLCFSTEGPFGYSRKPTFIFPKVPGPTFFPNLSRFITFAAAPLVLTTFVRNQKLGVAIQTSSMP